MKLDDLIYRHYTSELEDSDKTVYDLFKWKKVDVKLFNHSTGEIITDMTNLEFPEDYSQSACDIIASKYFRKKGIPNDRGYEYSMKQIAHRMVLFWIEALFEEKLISQDQKKIVYDELVYTFLNQMWAPNSPQWFNTGLKLAYNISGQAHNHYYYDENLKKVVVSGDSYTRTQGSACFIISVDDSLIGDKSLSDELVTETLLFKYGSGVGTNWSAIRAKCEGLFGGGQSSGLLSFLKVSDRNAGAIKSGGTTRRAAKMNILDIDHPEIIDFITWKAREEDKVHDLGKMGYSTAIDGEAYETVSGQNANNSIRVSNDFMKSLDDPDALLHTKGRVDDKANKDLQIKDVWDKISWAAWRCGDPGIQFDDTINSWHTCPAGEDGNYNAKHNRINASNPCSEYMFLDDTACNLASINVAKFYDGERFDCEGYIHVIKIIQLVLEATIYWGQFPTKDIARKSYKFRTTGLGLTNLGMLIMQNAFAYDSQEARNFCAALCSIMTGYSYYISSLMAEKIGAFEGYKHNKEYMECVINNHAVVANYSDKDNELRNVSYDPTRINHDILIYHGFKNLSDIIKYIWKETIDSGKRFGFRNAQVTVLAPTGTIAFAMDCVTTSSEPFFSHIVYKKLVGGAFMQIVNPVLSDALEKLRYNQNQISEIINYVMSKDENGFIKDGKIEGAPHLKPEHYNIFDTASKCGTGQRLILPQGHVRMMAALTPHITGAISKTVNMSHEATQDDIKEIYKLSWQLGVKAITVYRDGCKECQPLSSQKSILTEKPFEDYTYQELIDFIKSSKHDYIPIRTKPAGIRKAHVHEAAINGLKLYITTSFYEDGKLGEIYVSSGRQGSLVKGLLDSISTIISETLQYGVKPENIAKMYRGQKYEPSGFVTGHPYIKYVDSISDLISKIIDIELGDYTYCQVKPENFPEKKSNYNVSDYIYGEVCPTCKSTKLVKNGTCKVCAECGSTTGCS